MKIWRIQNFTIIDALTNFEFYKEGLIDILVVANNQYERFLKFYKCCKSIFDACFRICKGHLMAFALEEARINKKVVEYERV